MIAAFGAGILSFFTPCILPIIPAYICFITGLSIEGLDTPDIGKKKIILAEAVLFILGFSAVFVILGASATALGSYLFAKQRIFMIIGGAVVILFGLHIAGLFNIKILQYEKKFHLKNKPINRLGSFLIGATFGFAWAPCTGPLLSGILVLAATKDRVAEGVLLLSFYSLGLAIPFLAIGIGIRRALGVFSKIKRYFKVVSIISGLLLVAIGVWVIILNL